MATPGSDCPRGKTQYATKTIAMGAARQLRRSRGGPSANAYRCGWCGCWHCGNKGGDTSKGRKHRR